MRYKTIWSLSALSFLCSILCAFASCFFSFLVSIYSFNNSAGFIPNKKIESIIAIPIAIITVPIFPTKFINPIAQIAPTAPPPIFLLPL